MNQGSQQDVSLFDSGSRPSLGRPGGLVSAVSVVNIGLEDRVVGKGGWSREPTWEGVLVVESIFYVEVYVSFPDSYSTTYLRFWKDKIKRETRSNVLALDTEPLSKNDFSRDGHGIRSTLSV